MLEIDSLSRLTEKPTEEVFELAAGIVEELQAKNLPIQFIEPNHYGGIGIQLGQESKRVWIGIMNDGRKLLVFTIGRVARTGSWGEGSVDEILQHFIVELEEVNKQE